MASLTEELITILKSQMKNYEELLILSEEKKSVIMKNDIDMLQKITAAENTIIGRNQKLENKREECIKDIALVLNQDFKELTITKILELIKNQKEYNHLLSIRDKLKEILDSLKVQNDQNKTLIESSLDYVDFSVNLLRADSSKDQVYYSQQQGEVLQQEKNLFDAKQ